MDIVDQRPTLETLPLDIINEFFQTLLKTYGLAAAVKFSSTCKGLRQVFTTLPLWEPLAPTPNGVGSGTKARAFRRVCNLLNSADRALCGSCFKPHKEPLFVMIDNSACPLCKDCVQHVWSACKSVRTASFASDAYQDAFADAGLGLTISRSQVIAIRPPKFPHDKLLVEPLPLEAGARNGPRYLLVDVLRAIYQYSAGQPGLDAVARARQRQKDRWRQAGLEAYQNVVRRFVALYDPTKVLTDGDLAQDPNVLRVTDGVALAFDHGRHIIVGDMFRKIMRDANVNGNLDALLGVFTMHLDECIRVPFDSNVPTFRTIAQIAASPEKDFGRVINKKGLDRWENKIRGITCLAHAVVESYNAVCEISSLSQSFLDRNLWAYYASLGLGRMSFVGDSIISSITREDLDPVNVDDALCCWHFFNSQSGVYSIHGFDNIVQWTENQLRIWALIRMDPPQSNYRLLTHAASQMLPDSMIAFVNGFIQRTARMRMAEEIRTNLENRMHLEALRGTGNTVSSIAEDVNDRIPFSQLQKLVSTVSLRRFIGPTYNVVAEETLRETCRSLARTIIWQHLLTHAQPITRARIQDDDFRPVSNRNVTFNQLRFPCELWPRFENELVKEVRAMVGRQAASKDEAIEKLRAKGELKPNLELYIKSSRFSLAPKAFGI